MDKEARLQAVLDSIVTNVVQAKENALVEEYTKILIPLSNFFEVSGCDHDNLHRLFELADMYTGLYYPIVDGLPVRIEYTKMGEFVTFLEGLDRSPHPVNDPDFNRLVDTGFLREYPEQSSFDYYRHLFKILKLLKE